MPEGAVTALEVVATVWFFLLGGAVGSFLNVVVYRMPRGLSVAEPRRSFCPSCREPIRWYDNIPVLSFLLLRRRCRHCEQPISWRYPLVELTTALLFALIYFRQGAQVGADLGHVIVMLLVAGLLVAASAIDMDWLIIPDELSLFGILGGLAAGFLLPGLHVGAAPFHTFESLTAHPHLDGLIGALIGAFGGGGIVLAFALVGTLIFRKEAMGMGDVKLMAMVGAFFGWKVVLVAFFLSPFVGLLYGIPLLMRSGRHTMPYGPFLSIGALAAITFRTALCRYVEPLEYLVDAVLG